MISQQDKLEESYIVKTKNEITKTKHVILI